MALKDHQKIRFGGGTKGGSRAGVKPTHAATYLEIRAAIESAHLTREEARLIGLTALRRVRTTQSPMDKGSERFYREADEGDLEETACPASPDA